MAGESARTKAERHRELAGRYERGAEGEEATAAALAGLPPDTWAVIHDVAWPGRALANIDHVAIGPSGVFVIDSKNWTGRVTIGDDVLRQNGRARASTVRSAEAAAAAVAELLPKVRRSYVHAALCFSGGDAPRGMVGEVLVSSTYDVVDLLASGPPVLAPEQVRAASQALRRSLASATAPRRTRSGPRSSRRAPERRRPLGALVSVAAGALAAMVLVTNPGPLLAVSNGVADLFVGQVEPAVDSPTSPREQQRGPDGQRK